MMTFVSNCESNVRFFSKAEVADAGKDLMVDLMGVTFPCVGEHFVQGNGRRINVLTDESP